MKTIVAVFLLLVSTSLLAARPDCSLNPGGCANISPSANNSPRPDCSLTPQGCANNSPSNVGGGIAAVPEPGSLALIGFGLAGLIASRRRKK